MSLRQAHKRDTDGRQPLSDCRRRTDNALEWINPVGGYGDMLMVSGVLKQVHDRDPKQRFNLVQRTRYRSIFQDHEAIAHIGYPREDNRILRVDYWSMEEPGPNIQRPYQILARGFGLSTPIEEKLYLAGLPGRATIAEDIPWKDLNILIGPASDSPRKMMRFEIWHQLVDMLRADGAFVFQPGLMRDIRVRNAYSLRGMTTPQEIVTLLSRCDLVITLDNFFMHAAKLAGIPAIVVWGPTWHQMYGYEEHFHLQTVPSCGRQVEIGCIHCKDGGENGSRYGTPCSEGKRHCLETVSAQEIYETARRAIAGENPSAMTFNTP